MGSGAEQVGLIKVTVVIIRYSHIWHRLATNHQSQGGEVFVRGSERRNDRFVSIISLVGGEA